MCRVLKFHCGRLALFALLAMPTAAAAQVGKARPAASATASQTRVSIEIFTGKEGVGLRAQRWGQLFEKLKVPFTIRPERAGDKLETTESSTGKSLRQVHVVGRIDDRGRLVVSDRTFAESDLAKIDDWLKDLRSYGAQGAPAGQPMWGLSKTQFGEVHRALSEPLKASLAGQPIDKALSLLTPSAGYSLQYSPSAARVLNPSGDQMNLRQNPQGLSKGTALAIVLNDLRLGFRPRRNPSGDLDLLVLALSESVDVWPIGWPPPQGGPAVAPKLYQFVQVELDDQELPDVLDAVAESTGIPILVDHAGLAARRIDLSSLKVSHPAKRTTWLQVLKRITSPAGTKLELYVDDLGKPFLWLTPIKSLNPGPGE